MADDSRHAFDLLLGSDRTLGTIRVRETHVETSAGPVLHGMDTDGGIRLLVPVDSKLEALEDRASAGVQVHARRLIDSGTARWFMDVSCLKPHLEELFCVVADEILADLASSAGRRSGAIVLDVLERWRELLERPRSSLLGPEQIVGLLAELLELAELAGFDPRASLNSWRGPLGHRVDFQAGAEMIEIKGSTVRERREAEIHGLLQLDVPTGGRATLIHRVMEPAGHSDDTVTAVVDRLLEIGVERRGLYSRLAEAGVSPEDIVKYRSLGFTTLSCDAYDVDEHFPRIVPTIFRDPETDTQRISKVRYVVDLEGLPTLSTDALNERRRDLVSAEAPA